MQAGEKIMSATQTVTAVLADPVLANVLEVQQGVPLIKITRLLSAEDGKPVQYIEVVHRPDMYQLSMTLRPTDASGDDSNLWQPGALQQSD